MGKKTKSAPLLLAAPANYYYYVTYSFPTGVGCIAVNLKFPINNWDRIQIVVEMIRKDKSVKGKQILTNWILL